ncbi:unnamed protein product [Caenorhabditis bovis]|uniref:Uncharacterized protein n=1 Tax=Caenorhabditis bovis TaxID=2654633 RepID=A0A8S1EUU4_9PELO|nr:unnamed protein product [Caenorhabditis bovis]
MTDRSIPLRIPRVSISKASSPLSAWRYESPFTDQTSPSYIVDHLNTRRLTEIDPYLSLRSPRLDYSAMPSHVTYNSVPLRIRTAFSPTKSGRDFASNYPVTAQICGLTPPRIADPAEIQEELTTNSESDDSPKSNHDVDRLALFNNSSLSYQRICFLISRYPAVALCLVSMWMMWGRGLELNSVNKNEHIAHILAFTTSVFVLSCQVLLSASHHNSYKTAKLLSNFYHFANITTIMISITAIVFSAISFSNVKSVNREKDICRQMDINYTGNPDGECFSPYERTVFLSIIIGSASLIIVLFVFSIGYGVVGQALMKNKRQTQFKMYAAAQDNAEFRY